MADQQIPKIYPGPKSSLTAEQIESNKSAQRLLTNRGLYTNVIDGVISKGGPTQKAFIKMVTGIKAEAARQRAFQEQQAKLKASQAKAQAEAQKAKAAAEAQKSRIAAEKAAQEAELTRLRVANEKARLDAEKSKREGAARREKARIEKEKQLREAKIAKEKAERDAALERERANRTLAIRAGGVVGGVILGPGINRFVVERGVASSFAKQSAKLAEASQAITAAQALDGRTAAGRAAAARATGIANQSISQGLLNFQRGRAGFYFAGALATSAAVSATLSRTAFKDDPILRTLSETGAIAQGTGAIALTFSELAARSQKQYHLDAVHAGNVRGAAGAPGASPAPPTSPVNVADKLNANGGTTGRPAGWSDEARKASAAARKEAAGAGTVRELRKAASQSGITGSSRMSKAAILQAFADKGLDAQKAVETLRQANATSGTGPSAAATASSAATQVATAPKTSLVGRVLRGSANTLRFAAPVGLAATVASQVLGSSEANAATAAGEGKLEKFLKKEAKRAEETFELADFLAFGALSAARAAYNTLTSPTAGVKSSVAERPGKGNAALDAERQAYLDRALKGDIEPKPEPEKDLDGKGFVSRAQQGAQEVLPPAANADPYQGENAQERQHEGARAIADTTGMSGLYAAPAVAEFDAQSQHKQKAAAFAREGSNRVPEKRPPRPIPEQAPGSSRGLTGFQLAHVREAALKARLAKR